MTRTKFIAEYTRFIQYAIRLAEKTKKRGITALEENVWDLDESIFKDGLILITDEAEPAIVNEILSNKIAHEKDKYKRLYKTIEKRAVLGIQAGEKSRILYKILSSIAGLTSKDERKIELSIIAVDETEPEEEDSEGELSPFDTKIISLDDKAIQIILRKLDSDVLSAALKQSGKRAKGKIFNNLSKRAASMLKEDIDYSGTDGIEEAQKQILSLIENFDSYAPSENKPVRGVETTDKDDLNLDGEK